MVTLVELIKREDGSVAAYGNSIEVEQAEAKKLIEAGTHKDLSTPLSAPIAPKEKEIEKPKKKKEEIKE